MTGPPRWLPLLQTRHTDDAYKLLGRKWSEFTREGEYWMSRDGRYRVDAHVDDWGHSCRLVEYSSPCDHDELADVYARLEHRHRVEAKVWALKRERGHGPLWKLQELCDLYAEAEDLLRP